MSCHAILKNLYEPKMDAILTIRYKITAGIEITKQMLMCISVLKSIIMFFHSLIVMEYAFTLFFLLLIA